MGHLYSFFVCAVQPELAVVFGVFQHNCLGGQFQNIFEWNVQTSKIGHRFCMNYPVDKPLMIDCFFRLESVAFSSSTSQQERTGPRWIWCPIEFQHVWRSCANVRQSETLVIKLICISLPMCQNVMLLIHTQVHFILTMLPIGCILYCTEGYQRFHLRYFLIIGCNSLFYVLCY